MFRVTYAKGVGGSEKFCYTTKESQKVIAIVGKGTREKTLAPETHFQGMNGAVELAGDMLRFRIVPDNRERTGGVSKVLEIMPGDSKEEQRLTLEYGEALRAKLPVQATPFTVASRIIDPDNTAAALGTVDNDLYEEAIKYERVTYEFKQGQKIITRYKIFAIEEVQEAANAVVAEPRRKAA